ncbi:hypothetical protein [Streptomyces chartreusis]|uniref:hypothetical protein n=1 Tax=Streptomyces chartreusis TaxID=1969 RepID=UPI00382DF27D
MNLLVDADARNSPTGSARHPDTTTADRIQTSAAITEPTGPIAAEPARATAERAVLASFPDNPPAIRQTPAMPRRRTFPRTRTHARPHHTRPVPSPSEAPDRAFQSFTVRPAITAAGPNGHRTASLNRYADVLAAVGRWGWGG